MSVSLRGNLKDFGIADVFQLIGQQRKTGILEFSGAGDSGGERIQLLFDRGSVVSAAPVGLWPQAALGEMLLRCGLLSRDQVEDLKRECEATAQTLPSVTVTRGWLGSEELRQIEDLLTRETIFLVLRWKVGSFNFTAQEIEHSREFETLLGAEQILMDGLRMVDEWQSFAGLVPSEELIFRQQTSFDQYREAAKGEAGRQIETIERIFDLVDGKRSVRRIIDLSRQGSFDSVRALAFLRNAQAIETVEPSEEVAKEPRVKFSARRLPEFRRLAAVAVPLALLLLVAAFPQMRPVGNSPDPFTIQRPGPLEVTRRAHEKQRVRNALETYWFRHGRWPADLGMLESEGLLSRGELASDMGRPYYYANREDGAWLLAPDR